MRPIKVLISGASIAGPALALWLSRYGCTVTVVEKAPALRTGGQAVDFKGQAHLAVLKRMGLLEEVRRHRTGTTDMVFVDAEDSPQATMPGEFSGGDLEIRRGDLARILYEATSAACEYIFDDSIASLTQTATGVETAFDSGAARTFDLVVGADGIHSQVRRLAFGPEERYVKHLGHYYAIIGAEEDLEDRPALRTRAQGRMYNEPGRMASIDGPEAPAFFVFASDVLDYDRFDSEAQRKVLAAELSGMGWRVPAYLAGSLPHAEVFLDSISRVEMDHYTRGRIALLGDAAYGNTLGGFGTGLAIVGAYILAGEIAAAEGDHPAAFARYEHLMRPYAKIARKANAGPFLAPATRSGIWMRNLMFKSKFLLRLMMKLTDDYATGIDLPEYRRPTAEEHPRTEP